MSSTYGENLHLTIFGQSHSPAIGVTVEGIPAGEKVDLDELQRFLNRRAPGKNVWSTPRKEADAPEILSGLVNGYTCGAPAGLGDPMFGGMENRIASAVFGIPAVKGVEFGAGFGVASLRGSEDNDAFTVENGKIITETNHCGGILGGITNGMPIVFRAAFKPTPSIAREQQSVNLQTMVPEKMAVTGRHDPCIVPRAVPCVEAAAAIAVYDAYLSRKREMR